MRYLASWYEDVKFNFHKLITLLENNVRTMAVKLNFTALSQKLLLQIIFAFLENMSLVLFIYIT